MKFRTTQKAIKSNFTTIIAVGYCELQYLLRFKNPVAYTCGREGWYADIYDIDGIAIVTGYRPFGNVSVDYQTLVRYETEAERIIKTSNDIDNDLNILLRNFIKEARGYHAS